MQTVGAMLIRDGRVLLGRRAAHKSYPHSWDIVGGHVEVAESPWPALCRELQEEIGVTNIQGEYIATVHTGEANAIVPLLIYAIYYWEGHPIIQNDEHTEIAWFDKDQIVSIRNLVCEEYRQILIALLVP